MSGLIETKAGGLAVTKLVPKEDLSAPGFYGDRRTGFCSWLNGFICPDSYSISFDLMGGCRVCSSEHQVFPSNLMGTLVVGDAYTPCDIGGKGKCVPVFRQHNAGFREIKDSLRFLLRLRKTQGGSYVGRPNLIIISLPAYLKAVGPERYLLDFQKFKGWVKHFLQTGSDYELDDHRVLKPCDSGVEVCEGFALFKRGDSGLAESFSVIARSLKILTAVDPSNKSGFFHEVMQNTMTEYCLDPPPHSGLVRYYPIVPVEPTFCYHSHMTIYAGLPELQFVDGNVNPEVGVFYKKELISRISAYYSKGSMGDYIEFLPLLDDIESAIPCDPAGQPISPENTLQPNSNSETRVLVIGNSNMHIIHNELKKTIEDTVDFVKYPFDFLAEHSEIESFVAGLNLTSSHICVLGGQGNSLLQGMSTPKFKKHEPSGKPAGFTTIGAGKTKVFHALNVASYDPEYLDKFGEFAEKIVGIVSLTGAKVIFITPFPRYPTACCSQSGHFCAGFDGNLFNAEVVRLGTFIALLQPLKDAFVLTPEDFSHRDDYVSRGFISMIRPDCVHLTDRGIKAVVRAASKCVHLLKVVPPAPIPALGDPIPSGTNFSTWCESYRETCGFEMLKPTGSGKRPAPSSGQPRSLKLQHN